MKLMMPPGALVASVDGLEVASMADLILPRERLELALTRITAAHGFDDVEHTLIDRVVRHTFPAQQMIQMLREVRVSSVESANCSGSGHSEGLEIGRAHV